MIQVRISHDLVSTMRIFINHPGAFLSHCQSDANYDGDIVLKFAMLEEGSSSFDLYYQAFRAWPRPRCTFHGV